MQNISLGENEPTVGHPYQKQVNMVFFGPFTRTIQLFQGMGLFPMANLKTAVTRTRRDDKETVYGPEYRVSIHEALKAYTINAAWQIHKDDELGSLEVNKKADLLILSKNPYQVDPMELESIEVVDTFMDGHRTKLSKLSKVSGGKFLVFDDWSPA